MDNYFITLQNLNNNTNSNIYNRNIPSENLQPNLSVRPVLSKYQTMPILSDYKKAETQINNFSKFNINETFNPGNTKSHFSGFAYNIDDESKLRNQFFALQKSDQSVYVPNSNSDMYSNPINFINVNKDLNNELLFKNEQFNDFNPKFSNLVGNNLFNNSTRVQLKNIK